MKWVDYCKQNREKPQPTMSAPPPTTLTWAYGVTTTNCGLSKDGQLTGPVPDRINNLLPRTLESLRGAGFDQPRLFVDGAEDGTAYEHFGLEVTTRFPTIRTHGNWVLSLYELYIRNPTVDRYAMFQDDFVTYKNLRQYFDHCEYPERGYLNLYTFPKNQARAPKDGSTGFYLSNQLGKGAVALVFDLTAVEIILTAAHMFSRPQNAKRGWRAVDGGIVDSMKKGGGREYVHNPSLVQHTGINSSMGNRKHQLANSFRGEDFNALDLL